MRPAKVTDNEIIEAGKRLEQKKSTVNGWSLRKEIGSGKPDRLEKVWLDYKNINSNQNSEAEVNETHILPRLIEESLNAFIDKLSTDARAIITTSDAKANEIADEKAKSVYKILEEEKHNLSEQLLIATNLLDEADKNVERLADSESKNQVTESKFSELDKNFAMLQVKSDGLETLLVERQKLIEEKSIQLTDLKSEANNKKKFIDKIKKLLTQEQLGKLETG
jgi:hypothetical protein